MDFVNWPLVRETPRILSLSTSNIWKCNRETSSACYLLHKIQDL